MAYRNNSRISNCSSSSLRLNYLYPSGDVQDYGRKLYIFSSSHSYSDNSMGHHGKHSSLEEDHQIQTDQKASKSGRDQCENFGEVQQRLDRVQHLLRLEREQCREREDTVASLRRIVDEHERRMHHIDGITTGIGTMNRTAELVRASPTQKLLDQVNRLQQQKTELLIQLSHYKDLLGPQSPALSQLNQMDDCHANRSTSYGVLRNINLSEADVPYTDTEKELKKLKTTNQKLELELKKLTADNKLLRHEIVSNSTSSSTEIVKSQNLTESVSQVLPEKDVVKQNLTEPASQALPETDVVKQNLIESISQVLPETDAVKQNLTEPASQVLRETQAFARFLARANMGAARSRETVNGADVYPRSSEMWSLSNHLEYQAKNANIEDLQERPNGTLETASRNSELESQNLTIQRLTSELGVYREGFTTILNQCRELRCEHSQLREKVLTILGVCSQLMSNTTRTVQISHTEALQSHSHVMAKYLKEMQRRRKYHNQLVELKGNIRVLCRVRPRIKEDGSGEDNRSVVALDPDDDGKVMVTNKGRIHHFDVDKAFGVNSSQSEVFGEISSLVRSAMDGFNVCIFAYGQTGSGKTYTMEGPSCEPGIQYRALQLLFEEATDSDWCYTFSASMLEIYNETLIDLLNPDQNTKLEVKLQPDGSLGVPGLTQVTVTSEQDVAQVFEIGREQRATESTVMNSRSSRSHCLLYITVSAQNLITNTSTFGRLNFVDLAGSERVSKTRADGERLREARNINRSLSCLGDVIHALRTRQQHIPYRNSKLTYLLQDSLGGDSKTLMIVQVAPNIEHVRETLCTLSFGMRVTTVELGTASTTTKVTSQSGSDSPRWRHSVDLDLSFSSASSMCSSPFSSPPTSPCPSPCCSPSPSPVLSHSPSQSAFLQPGAPVRNIKSLRRTVSTSSVQSRPRRQLPSPSGANKSRPLPSHTVPSTTSQSCTLFSSRQSSSFLASTRVRPSLSKQHSPNPSLTQGNPTQHSADPSLTQDHPTQHSADPSNPSLTQDHPTQHSADPSNPSLTQDHPTQHSADPSNPSLTQDHPTQHSADPSNPSLTQDHPTQHRADPSNPSLTQDHPSTLITRHSANPSNPSSSKIPQNLSSIQVRPNTLSVQTRPNLSSNKSRPNIFSKQTQPTSSPTQARQSLLHNQICSTLSLAEFSQEKNLGKKSELSPAVSTWQAVTLNSPDLTPTTSRSQSPNDTPTTSRSQSPNDTPTTTPTSSPIPTRKCKPAAFKHIGATATSLKRVQPKKFPRERKCSTSALPVRERWK